MAQMKVEFVKERDTKNTVMFMEQPKDGQAEAIGRLYVQKSAMETLGQPEKLTVTLLGK